MKTLIKNGVLLTPETILRGCGMVLDDGKILGFCADSALDEAERNAEQIIDAEGLYISPGFIDIHVHGGGGHDFMDGTADAFLDAVAFHMQHGTTTIVPTTLSGDDLETIACFHAYQEAKQRMHAGPEMLGLHLEGPYFALSQRGAQDPAFLRNPSPAHYLSLLNESNDIVRWTAAPELPGALAFGDILAECGILPSIGHTDAVYTDVLRAIEHGYTHVTHLYSGMSSLRRVNAYRQLGVVESAYLLDQLTVEIIADGKHLPVELLQLICKCKPLSHIILITDCIRCAGREETEELFIGSKAHGQRIIIEDEVAKMPDRSCFAGSISTMDRCVRTMIQTGVPLLDAVKMATKNPAVRMGIDQRKGALEINKDADLCVFTENIDMRYVICGGTICYKR